MADNELRHERKYSEHSDKCDPNNRTTWECNSHSGIGELPDKDLTTCHDCGKIIAVVPK